MTKLRTRRRTAGLAVAALLALTGCGSDVLDNPYEKPSESDSAQAAATLATLPSLEDTEAQVQHAVEQLATYISTLVPGMQWTWMNDRMGGGCSRPYNGTEGSDVALQNYVATTTVTESVWPQIFERAKELAASVGATQLERFHDEPGNHDVRFYSTEGTAIHVGAGGNTVIGSSTGCRLPQAKMTATPSASIPHP